ncbi:hypothetical protein AB0957_30945 [Streptomyces zhihengii]|uniref:hypothetical protein n=1 Tax=Streptomyces zhihengii TaxID=1818004 RepID=UPI003456A6AA
MTTDPIESVYSPCYARTCPAPRHLRYAVVGDRGDLWETPQFDTREEALARLAELRASGRLA